MPNSLPISYILHQQFQIFDHHKAIILSRGGNQDITSAHPLQTVVVVLEKF